MKAGKYVLYHSKQIKNKAIYVYHFLAWYYRKDKKPYRENLKNLGVLNQGEIERYKLGVAYLNNEKNVDLCNIDKVEVTDSKDYLPCAVGAHFWKAWELSSVFPATSKRAICTSDIAMILTIIRWVQTCSKSLSTELYPETCLPELTGVDPKAYNNARIFRELENIEKHREKLGRHIFNLARKKGYTKSNILFYDLSSANITGLRCTLSKWGHCKDGYQTHVVLLLVITPEGYPVYWEILEGNTPDVTTIEGLIDKIENTHGKIESVICFDRGMVSDQNLILLEEKGIKYITALDGDQLKHFENFIPLDLFNKVKSLDLKSQAAVIKKELTESNFKFVQDNLFFQELHLTEEDKDAIEKKTEKLGLDKRRYFLAFNPELAYLTQKHRLERVEEFTKWIDLHNKELSTAKSSRKKETIEKAIKQERKRRKILDVQIPYTLTEHEVKNRDKNNKLKHATTFKIELGKIDYEQATQKDGVWMLITNISKSEDKSFLNSNLLNSYFEVYRLKNNIEESFKILSQFVGIEPFYVYKPEHVRAHFTICVLSYLLDITILNKIRNSSEIANMSLDRIFRILKKCRQNTIQINETTTSSKITQVTREQKQLLAVFNCNYLVEPDYVGRKGIANVNNMRA